MITEESSVEKQTDIIVLALPSGLATQFVDTLSLFPVLIEGTQFIAKSCEEKIDAPMHATDLAIELSTKGVPFRTAYQQVANSYEELEQRQPIDSLNARISPGGCGNLMLDELAARLNKFNLN